MLLTDHASLNDSIVITGKLTYKDIMSDVPDTKNNECGGGSGSDDVPLLLRPCMKDAADTPEDFYNGPSDARAEEPLVRVQNFIIRVEAYVV